MDGQVFPITDFAAGATAPPFHPRCRGTTCPYFDDEFTKGEVRASRGKDGKTTLVPDMPYKEWRKQYVSAGGLGAGNNSDVEKGPPPKFDGKIDASDAKLVESRLEAFRDEVINDTVESAFVILQNGKTYRFTGTKDRVYPDLLGTALRGSVMTHNHPIMETRFSFSRDDFDFFQQYGLAELHGFDEKYEYVLHRVGKSPEIEKAGLFDMTKEQFHHQTMHELAERKGVFYERIERAVTGGGK